MRPRNVKRILSTVVPVTLVALVAATGCATKKFVARQVDERVADVETQVEQVQVRLQDQGEEITTTSRTAQEALDRATSAGKLAQGKLLYETVLTDEQVKFGFNQSQLSPEAQAALEEFASQLKSRNENVYIEIQGHTDEVGADGYNEQLGLARAEAARHYLAKQGLPLHRMSSISYGESAPIADNASQQGRAQNRRVALVVLQ